MSARDPRQHAIDLLMEIFKQLNNFALAGMAGVITLATFMISVATPEDPIELMDFAIGGGAFVFSCLLNYHGQMLLVACAQNSDKRLPTGIILVSTAILGFGVGYSLHTVLT